MGGGIFLGTPMSGSIFLGTPMSGGIFLGTPLNLLHGDNISLRTVSKYLQDHRL